MSYCSSSELLLKPEIEFLESNLTEYREAIAMVILKVTNKKRVFWRVLCR